MNLDVNQRNVSQSDSRLSLASTFSIKRVQHASRSVSVWFFHLLWTDVNCPPNGSVHSEIPIIDISDIAISFIARIGLYVDTFKWSFLNNISKGDVSHATATDLRRYTSYSEANTQYNLNVFNKHVSCAVVIPTWFWDDDIIPILDSQVVNMHSSA